MSDERTKALVTKPAANSGLKSWKKGQSGNPSGRPKSLPRFRVGCRNDSFKIKREIMKRIEDPDVPLAEIVKAFEAIADRGGFIVADKELTLEIAKAQLLVAAAAARAKFGSEEEFLRFTAELQEPGKGREMLATEQQKQLAGVAQQQSTASSETSSDVADMQGAGPAAGTELDNE
jgi:hypothetical protein